MKKKTYKKEENTHSIAAFNISASQLHCKKFLWELYDLKFKMYINYLIGAFVFYIEKYITHFIYLGTYIEKIHPKYNEIDNLLLNSKVY